MRWFLLIGLLALSLQAADYYVDNSVGSDDFNGLAQTPDGAGAGPKGTITAALKAAQPGDTVHINPTGKVYRQIANFYGLAGGEPGKPITLDGHGVTLDGADPCPKDGWETFAGETLMRNDLVPRGFIMLDGRMIGMIHRFNVLKPGEFCYQAYSSNRLYFLPPEGTKHADNQVEVGQPDGTSVVLDGTKWQQSHSAIRGVYRYNGLKQPTWIKLNGENVPMVLAQDRLEPGQWTADDGAFYFNPPQDRELVDLEILCPVRENGVMMNGNTKHVVVRNINVQHVHNDGFNIHGNVTASEFYNCNAHDCGDEGFSAHDTCETLLDGAVYVNCDNGIANVNSAGSSITRNVVLAQARHVGYLIQNHARHELTNAILVDNPNQFSAGWTKIDNVLIVRRPDAEARTSGLGLGPESEVRRVTVVGNSSLFRAGTTSTVLLDSVLFGPGQGTLHVRADDPAAILTLKNVVYATDQVLEWGTKYPWTRQPLTEWIAGPGAANATGCRALDIENIAALPTGAEVALPTGVGCTPELLARYRKWLQTGE